MADHQKISVLCMLMIHARDVTLRLVEEGAPGPSAYTWMVQIRHGWDKDTLGVKVSVIGASVDYGFEYFGRSESAMITPLTERCYVNILQVRPRVEMQTQ
jgi:hypothetical protein